MIDNRIKAVADFVNSGSRVADIGTDHGYLAIELVKSGKAKFVIASDKNAGPIDAAKKNICAAGLNDFIEVRIGDGLKVLRDGEVNTICIAGMGGSLISEILNDSPDILSGVEHLILQPMNAVDKLQTWLIDNGWLIGDIDLAEAGGIIYEIISATKDINAVNAVNKKSASPLLNKFITQKLSKLQRISDEMAKSPAATSTAKFAQIQSEIATLKSSLKHI